MSTKTGFFIAARVFLIAFLACRLGLAYSVSVDIRNPSFEIGDRGPHIVEWDAVGAAVTGCCFNGSTLPTNGNNAAVLSVNPRWGVSQAESEEFLELPSGKLNALGQGAINKVTAITQLVAIHAGRVLAFDFDFGIFEGNVGDFAFFSIAEQLSPGVFFDTYLSLLASTDSSLSVPPNPPCVPPQMPFECIHNSYPETGYRTFYLPIEETGFYQIGFGVANVSDTHQSAVIIDNVRIIPEPSTLALFCLSAGLLGLGYGYKRRRLRVGENSGVRALVLTHKRQAEGCQELRV